MSVDSGHFISDEENKVSNGRPSFEDDEVERVTIRI